MGNLMECGKCKYFEFYKIHYNKRKCGTCKYLQGESSVIGIPCVNPERTWRSKTAQYHYPWSKACKKYEEG